MMMTRMWVKMKVNGVGSFECRQGILVEKERVKDKRLRVWTKGPMSLCGES